MKRSANVTGPAIFANTKTKSSHYKPVRAPPPPPPQAHNCAPNNTVLQASNNCASGSKKNTAKGSSVTNSKHKVSNIPELVWICGSSKQAKGLGFNNNNNNNCASGNKKPNCQKFFCNNNSKPKGLNNPELVWICASSKQASPKP